MDHFYRRGGARHALALHAEKPRRLDREKGPEPLAAAKAGIAHRFEKSRRPHRLAGQDLGTEQAIEHALGRLGCVRQPGLEFACPRASRHGRRPPL